MDWLTPEMLAAELTQRAEEGCAVDDLLDRLEAWRTPARPSAGDLLQLWEEASGRTPARDFPYDEPSDLETIRRLRPPGPRRLMGAISDVEDRLHGAWLGRAAGCLLGKPVENWTRGRIRAVLEHAGAYPLADYFPWVDDPPADADYRHRPRRLFRGGIDGMPRDDDMDHTLLALRVLEAHGPAFGSDDVAHTWITSVPFRPLGTAERLAYRNLVNGLRPPATASYRNPWREWIGAAIRADLWGWVNPGRPERAAEFAFRDARVSHVKNGIYGEMFVAAMLAAAPLVADRRQVVEIGLSEIPAACRLAEAIRYVLTWHGRDGDWNRTTDRVLAAYGRYDTVHTINNLALAVMGFLYGEDDLGPAITRTVMAGLDVDCSAATVGSLVGLRRGAAALPASWVGPLHDRLESLVVGMADNRMADLARRTAALAECSLRA